MKKIAARSTCLLLAAFSALLLARAKVTDYLFDRQKEVWTTIVVGLPYTTVKEQLSRFAKVVPPEQAAELSFTSKVEGDQRDCFLRGVSMILIIGKDDRVTDIEVTKLEYR